jgi:putative peptidoglycan lipid II flippase
MALNLLRPPAITAEVRLVLKRMIPGVIGAGVVQLNLAVDIIIASLLPSGAISFLYYADRVAQLPLGVIGVAVGTALLPLLARQLRTGQALSAHRSINRAVELSLLLTVPAAVGLAVASGAIIAALFQRGAFGAVETQASSAALVAYAFGLPAFVLVKVFAPAFFARGDTATPVKIGLLAVALNLGFNVVLMGPLQHVGVALSTALAAWVNALLLAWVLLRRRAYVMDRRARRALPRILAAAAAMGVAVAALGFVLPAGADSIARALRAAVLIGVGAAVFLGAGLALRAFDPREVLRMLRRRRSNGA